MTSPSAPAVVALAGPNGAGKSTVGPALLRRGLGISTFVNADLIAQGLSALAPENVAFEAGRIMLARVEELGRRRVSFAFETTLAGRAYARRIGSLLERGYHFHVVFVSLESADLAVARVEDRVRAGGHAVPEEVVRRRYRTGPRNFFRLYLPLTTRWQVYDNSSAWAESPRLIARGAGEADPTVLDEPVWNRLRERALA